MNLKTIRSLNQLNQDFYRTSAKQFSQSRQFFWQGWLRLLPTISQFSQDKTVKVLDLGCGNGRFAQFLDKKTKLSINYTGLDSNQQLLDDAQKNLEKTGFEYQLQQLDLVNALLDADLKSSVNSQFDLIVVFGVLHHVPSFELRARLLQELGLSLTKRGVLVITAWQFAAKDRFVQKIINPKQLKLNPEQFEAGDFILDWKRGVKSYRYCHFTDQEELNKLANQTKNLAISSKFFSDGKSADLNLYLLLQKKH